MLTSSCELAILANNKFRFRKMDEVFEELKAKRGTNLATEAINMN